MAQCTITETSIDPDPATLATVITLADFDNSVDLDVLVAIAINWNDWSSSIGAGGRHHVVRAAIAPTDCP
jgi:hypothetical protein